MDPPAKYISSLNFYHGQKQLCDLIRCLKKDGSIHDPVLLELKARDALTCTRKVGEAFVSFDFDSILINYAKCVTYMNSPEEQLPVVI